MVKKAKLVEIVESSIKDLVSTFQRTPYFVYTENDLHTYLFHKIFSQLSLEEWLCETQDGRVSILLHKEYPTKLRYNAKVPERIKTKGARGHFDLCIWNPEKTGERYFRAKRNDFRMEQQTFIAIEFDLIEKNESCDLAFHHFEWDQLKLTDTGNDVEHGYQLVL